MHNTIFCNRTNASTTTGVLSFVHQISITAVAASQAQVVVQEIPEVPVVEWIQKQIVETIEVIPQEQIEVQIGDIPVPQEQLIAEVTTLNTSSTSTSSDRRLDEFANMLDSRIELSCSLL